ncbi:glutamine synthetase [bacterium]|nr:glutamine synthetase [bacterium]
MDLAYFVPTEDKSQKRLKSFLFDRPELKFVSLGGVDFLGNDTDERIPVEYFLGNIEEIFSGGVQTDGSSVSLPGIACLSNAKIDFIIDFESKWFIDYNHENKDDDSTPIGTVRIPVFFRFHDDFRCSRSVLANTCEHMKREVLALLEAHPTYLQEHDLQFKEIADVQLTLGTELEMWVRTPVDQVSVEELAVSQMLKESYWKRTKGQIRNCLEQSLSLLQHCGLEPEMGHKEVGGVKGKISRGGALYDVMEQLEIDWRFDSPLQAADNELFARSQIKELFRRHGLEVTYTAKPVNAVAGSGEHTHVGILLVLKNGQRLNLFHPTDNNLFLSVFGYGALMGLLHNWSSVNPFVTNSISALKRLQPGFEAPVSPVASLGISPDTISRNRTVLAGLVRSDNPLSTRFEVRAPNPHTNTYLAAAAIFLAMLDGMKANAGRSAVELDRELHKRRGDSAEYLNPEREYISEADIFDDYTAADREQLFGPSPRTVQEVMLALKEPPSLFRDTPLCPPIINSFYLSALQKWRVELGEKEIPNLRRELIHMQRHPELENDLDRQHWEELDRLRSAIARSSLQEKSLFGRLEEALHRGDDEQLSELSLELDAAMDRARQAWKSYRRNLLI